MNILTSAMSSNTLPSHFHRAFLLIGLLGAAPLATASAGAFVPFTFKSDSTSGILPAKVCTVKSAPGQGTVAGNVLPEDAPASSRDSLLMGGFLSILFRRRRRLFHCFPEYKISQPRHGVQHSNIPVSDLDIQFSNFFRNRGPASKDTTRELSGTTSQAQ